MFGRIWSWWRNPSSGTSAAQAALNENTLEPDHDPDRLKALFAGQHQQDDLENQAAIEVINEAEADRSAMTYDEAYAVVEQAQSIDQEMENSDDNGRNR